jgi:iron-sulfur cluster assembly protein
MITITDKGAEKVHEFLDSQGADVSSAGLRVGVKGGGCSGFQYNLAFDEQRDDVRVVDLEAGALQGAGFQVNNPNVVAACGCGSSFRVADEEEVSAV